MVIFFKVLVAMSLVGFLSQSSMAGDVGRYQAIAVPRSPDSLGTQIFILDTQEGDMWQLWESPTSGTLNGSRGLLYLGKAVPGAKMGDVLQRQIFPSAQ